MDYLTNDLGDIYARLVDGHEEPVNPDEWGWVVEKPELRRSVEDVSALPGFTVEVVSDPNLRRDPGPKPKRARGFFKSTDGSAPPAAAMSKAGAADGAGAQYGRLSDALAWSVAALPRNPGSRPFHVLDLLRGQRIIVDYKEVIAPGGSGAVYIVEDGIGVKVGHTTGSVALRIAALQTGNPRLISAIALVMNADLSVESHLHQEFAAWAMQGEWFDRSQLLAAARETNGWGALIRSRLPAADWVITVFPPYS